MSKKESGQPQPRLNLRGVQKYLNAVEGPRMENRRHIVIEILLGTALLFACGGYFFLLPLKEKVPYTLEVEKVTGNVVPTNNLASKFEPQERSIKYFLNQWAQNLLAVDEYSREQKLPASYAMVRGDAMGDWERVISEQEKPLDMLANDPNYRRQARVVSIQFLSQESVLIRVELTDNRGKTRRVQIAARITLIPPTNDEEIMKSPIGLWITTFGVTDELV